MTDQNEPQKRDYDYLLDMGIEGWTWEFIRRNPDYRKAWIEHCSNSKTDPDKETSTIITKQESSAAARFGLLFFRRPN